MLLLQMRIGCFYFKLEENAFEKEIVNSLAHFLLRPDAGEQLTVSRRRNICAICLRMRWFCY